MYDTQNGTAYSNLLSAQRNMFITTTLAITVIIFSDRLQDKASKYIIKLMGVVIFCFSTLFGVISTIDAKRHIRDSKKNLPEDVSLATWYVVSYFGYTYAIITICIVLTYIYSKFI